MSNDAGQPSHRTPSSLETAIGAAQMLNDEETKVLQAALAWDVEDVATAIRLMGEKSDPDFIPAWYQRDSGTRQIREAVRVIGSEVFPIEFLRSGEMVCLPKPPQRGVSIGNADHSEMRLAVPPGYWIVRDVNGEPRNWRHEDFSEQFTRIDRDWVRPLDRDPLEEGVRVFDQVVADEAEARAPQRPEIFDIVEDLAAGEGWKGTPPAPDTRRALIRDVLSGKSVWLTNSQGGHLTNGAALALADAVEEALLQAALDAKAMEAGAETLIKGIEKVRPIDGTLSLDAFCAAQKLSHHRLRVDDPGFREYHRGAEVAYDIVRERIAKHPESKDEIAMEMLQRAREVAVVRDDEWAQELAMAAITAGQEADAPFPGFALDDVLKSFEVKPTLPREWPGIHGRRDDGIEKGGGPQLDVDDDESGPEWGASPPAQDDGEENAERISEVKRRLAFAEFVGAKEATEKALHRIKWLEDRDDLRLGRIREVEQRCEDLLHQRELARGGEDHWKAQRDAALRLLTWLMPDLIENPSDTLGVDLDEAGSVVEDLVEREEESGVLQPDKEALDEIIAEGPPEPGEVREMPGRFDDRPTWRIEVDRALNHFRNAAADWLGL